MRKNNDSDVSCQEIIKSEDYYEIIHPFYPQTLEQDLANYNAVCYEILTPEFVVFYIDRQGKPIDQVYTPYAISEVPILYGLASLQSLDASGITETVNKPSLQLTGKDVIIAIVDTGIDYTHPAFINEDNTSKILNIWDQTGDGPSPKGFKFGTEYSQEDINKALKSNDPYSIVPQTDDIGHGTYLAGLAAGRKVETENFVGAAPDASLVIVKLKPAKQYIREYYFIQDDKIPVYQNTDVILGIRYAAQTSALYKKPVVLLYPGETNMASHSGSSYLTYYLDSLSVIPGLINIIPSGNEADKARHFEGNFITQKTDKIDMEVTVPEGLSGFMVSIFCRAPDRLSIAIKTPKGNYTERIPLFTDRVQQVFFVKEPVSMSIEYQKMDIFEGADQAVYTAVKRPTPGVWTFTVFGENLVNGTFNSYIFQFIDEATQFLQPNIYTTCTDPGNSEKIITVGGYDSLTGELYIPSGRGLTRRNKIKPDFVAPCVNVLGPLPQNKYGSFSGTSVGAAITSGAAALLMEWNYKQENNELLNTLEAKEFFINGTTQKEGIIYPNRNWGYGELNLYNSFEKYLSQ